MKKLSNTNKEIFIEKQELYNQNNELKIKIDELKEINQKVNSEANFQKQLHSMNEYDYLLEENSRLQDSLESKKREIKLFKLKEQKLMYLLFCAQKSGISLASFYEKL